jgi:hypothetical protein
MSRAKNSGTTPGRYRDAFVEHIAAALSGDLPVVRERLFTDWLERLPFTCEGAGCFEEFEVSAGEVHEDDLILCEKCRKGRH